MTLAAQSDEHLMLAYGAGDAKAFELLYARWRGKLFRYLQHQCGAKPVAEEAFQEIWLKVIRARTSYERSAKFSTWLFRIAHNHLIDAWRAAGRTALDQLASYTAPTDDNDGTPPDALAQLAAPEHDTPQRWLERHELAQSLADAIAALPTAQRETFLLMEEGDMTLDDIAQATQTTRETAKSRLRYAVRKLRNTLQPLHDAWQPARGGRSGLELLS